MSRGILWDQAFREEWLEKETRRRRRQREKAVLRPLPDDLSCVSEYRLDGFTLENLLKDIVPLLPVQKSTRAIDPVSKILLALSFYSRGDYQYDVAKGGHVAQQTMSRCLRQVTWALNNPIILKKYVKFPQTREDRALIKRGFYYTSKLPGIIGCIDCTHVAIVRPDLFEERFFNRKHYHSLNVQVISDHNCKILNVDARYGGATHDAFIWQYSQIKDHMESIASTGEQAILLGDSGYPLREYLMVPVEGAVRNSREDLYNKCQKKTRSTIERTFGILKGRWRCLLAARELHYTPEMAGKITIACSVLHNMCIDAGLASVELTEEEQEIEQERQPHVIVPSATLELQNGRAVRERIIAQLSRP